MANASSQTLSTVTPAGAPSVTAANSETTAPTAPTQTSASITPSTASTSTPMATAYLAASARSCPTESAPEASTSSTANCRCKTNARDAGRATSTVNSARLVCPATPTAGSRTPRANVLTAYKTSSWSTMSVKLILSGTYPAPRHAWLVTNLPLETPASKTPTTSGACPPPASLPPDKPARPLFWAAPSLPPTPSLRSHSGRASRW